MISEEVKLKVVYDNRKCDERLQGGWGFSCSVEWKKHKILFDTGADEQALFSNLEKLDIHLEEITHLIFSHKHADHTSGFGSVLKKINPQASIYFPKAFPRSFLKQITNHSFKIMNSSAQIAQDLHLMVLRGGLLYWEQALILHTSKGLVVITGCAHPGIVNLLKRVKTQFRSPIYLVLGGFHMFRKASQLIPKIIDQFQSLAVQNVAPCHCTGEDTIRQFEERYGAQFIKIGTGSCFEL